MALSSSTVLEVRNVADWSGASDVNGGGFVTGASGTDYSYASLPATGAAKYALTNGATNGTTTIATASASADMIGNIAYVAGGTGSITGGWYQIVSQTTGVSIVVDRSTGLTTGTGVTINIGGCLATLGGLGAVLALVGISGMRAWQKYSTSAYNNSNATANTSGGTLSIPTLVSFWLEGYDQARGDRTGNRPQTSWASVAAPGSIQYMLTMGNAKQGVANLTLNGNGVNNAGGLSLTSARNCAIQCVAENFNGTNGVGFQGTGGNLGCKSCYANACATGFSVGNVDSCCAIGGSGSVTGFLNTGMHSNCLATLHVNGFSTNGASVFDRCTADGNTTAGFVYSGLGVIFSNSVASNQSGGSGVGFSVSNNVVSMHNCASYNNTTEISGTPLVNEGMILTASFTGGQPYVVAGSDFRPNATAGAGLLLRGAGIGVFGQTDTVDIGAVQSTPVAPVAAVISKTVNNFYFNDIEA